MKKILLAALIASLFFACKANAPKAAATGEAPKASKSDVSYAFGLLIGTSMKTTDVALDYSAFQNGVKDAIEKKSGKVTLDVAKQQVQEAMVAASQKKSELNLAKEKEFFETNKKKATVKTTASGLQYEVIKEGTGPKPKETDTVKVDYVGTLIDGTVFDSSIERKVPAVFPLNGVIPGWTEGIQLMTVGSKYKLYIPSTLAYGPNGAGDKIAPNSTLIFEVDLLSIEPPAAPAPKGK
jgi:FKBP-type peptidyl-prolyl cis-trans isomerase FkpA